MAKKKTYPTKPESPAPPPSSDTGRKKLLRNFGLAALSATLIWLAFPPVDFGPVAWVALVPWLLVINRAQTKHATIISFVVGYALFVALLYWLRFVTIPGWFALAFYCALYWLLSAWLLCRLRKAGLPFMLTAPLILAALEFARANLLTGFPFLLISHTQYKFIPLIQLADLTGVYGITFILGMVNGLIADLILCGIKNRKSLYKIIIAATVFCLVIVSGMTKLSAHDSGHLKFHYLPYQKRIMLVQANVPIDLKHTTSIAQSIANAERHVRLSLDAADKNTDLIIWPETMLPAQLNLAYDEQILLRMAMNPEYADWRKLLVASKNAVKRTAEKTNAHLLIGAEALILGEPNQRFNSAYFLSPDAQILGRYDKIHRVVFGEYTPLENIFPFLKKLRPPQMGSSLSAGTKLRLFGLPDGDTPSAKFGVTICYEDSVASLFRKFVADGADFMVNITNDGWFKNSSELDVHLAICAFRAVENHIPIARCANTGISAFIDRSGRITKQITAPDGARREIEGTLSHDVTLLKHPGFYTRHGDLFAWLTLATLAVLLALPLLRKPKTQSP